MCECHPAVYPAAGAVTARPKCDHCGERAYTDWRRPEDSSELSFCGHCLRENAGKLEQALRQAHYRPTRDDRHTLERQPMGAEA